MFFYILCTMYRYMTVRVMDATAKTTFTLFNKGVRDHRRTGGQNSQWNSRSNRHFIDINKIHINCTIYLPLTTFVLTPGTNIVEIPYVMERCVWLRFEDYTVYHIKSCSQTKQASSSNTNDTKISKKTKAKLCFSDNLLNTILQSQETSTS